MTSWMASRDPDEMRRIAEEILARPEFDPPGRPWIERALDAVGRWLEGLLERLSAPAAAGSNAASWVILVGLVAGLAAALVLLAQRARRRGRRPRRRKATVAATVTEWARPRSAADLAAEADELAAGGRWREALRARYQALVAALAARHVLDDRPSVTTGEHRARVAVGVPPAAPPFADAAELFDRAWYGDQPTGPAEDEAFRSLAGAVLAEAPDREGRW